MRCWNDDDDIMTLTWWWWWYNYVDDDDDDDIATMNIWYDDVDVICRVVWIYALSSHDEMFMHLWSVQVTVKSDCGIPKKHTYDIQIDGGITQKHNSDIQKRYHMHIDSSQNIACIWVYVEVVYLTMWIYLKDAYKTMCIYVENVSVDAIYSSWW
jgi:hypothetical protein